MLAILMTLLAPVIPLICGLLYRRNQKTGEVVLRYVVYALIMVVLSSLIMVVTGAEDSSFMKKLDMSPAFTLKYVLMEIFLAAVLAGAEWLYVRKKVVVQVDWEHYRELWLFMVWKKVINPGLIYIVAALVVCLNVSLMFDNVLWGDEAFSANTAQKTMGGILEVLYYWDSHPPLYYYWLKLFGEVFGHVGVVYHLASIVPFVSGVIAALTLFRKNFGKIPATFFIIISGLGKACLQYNLEIRMYSLAFLCIAMSFFCAYRVISTGKKRAWIGMVLFALAGAYTHYYALITAGMIVFFTGAAVWMKHRGKSWLKGVCAVLIYIVGYIPWLTVLFSAMGREDNYWITEILGISQCLDIIMGGEGMKKIIFPLVVFFLLIGLVVESRIFRFCKSRTECRDSAVVQSGVEKQTIAADKREDKVLIQVNTPSSYEWSDKTYAMLVGAASIVGTLAAGYVLSVLFHPLLAVRYLYPLSSVTFIMLVIGSSQFLEWAEAAAEASCQSADKENACRAKGLGRFLYSTVMLASVVILLMLLVIGFNTYKAEKVLIDDQKARTEATLNLIGEPEKDVKMVATGVRHLSWTVLYYYYPENEIVAGDFRQANADKFWYFTANYLSEEELKELQESGYLIYGYGDMQISQYPFVLYYMEKEEVTQE